MAFLVDPVIIHQSVAPADSREGRLQLMLFAGLGLRSRPVADMQSVFDALWT